MIMIITFSCVIMKWWSTRHIILFGTMYRWKKSGTTENLRQNRAKIRHGFRDTA